MFKGIDHLVIAVNDLQKAVDDYQKMGFKAEHVGRVTPFGNRQALLYMGDRSNYIELVEPMSTDSPVARTLQRRGEGIHLIALAVEDVTQATAEMKSKGMQLMEGAGGPYLHPRDSHGILYQLVERK